MEPTAPLLPLVPPMKQLAFVRQVIRVCTQRVTIVLQAHFELEAVAIHARQDFSASMKLRSHAQQGTTALPRRVARLLVQAGSFPWILPGLARVSCMKRFRDLQTTQPC